MNIMMSEKASGIKCLPLSFFRSQCSKKTSERNKKKSNLTVPNVETTEWCIPNYFTAPDEFCARLISNEYFLCLINSSNKYDQSIVIFDTRPREDYLLYHINDSINIYRILVGSQKHKIDSKKQSTKPSGTYQIDTSELQFSTESIKYFNSACKFRTVIVYGKNDALQEFLLKSFLVAFKKLNIQYKELLALKGGIESLGAWQMSCLTKSLLPSPPPIKILRCCETSVFICDMKVASMWQAHFHTLQVKRVFNLTSQRCVVEGHLCKVSNFSCYGVRVMPYTSCAKSIKGDGSVLIYDETGDTHTAAVCVWFLIMQGMQFLKAKAYMSKKVPLIQFNSKFEAACANLEENIVTHSVKYVNSLTDLTLMEEKSDDSSAVQSIPLVDPVDDMDEIPIVYQDALNLITKAKENYNKKLVIDTLNVLHVVIVNLLSYPKEEKFRRIRSSNEKFKNTVLAIKPALQLLVRIGFKLSADNVYKISTPYNRQNLQDIKCAIEANLAVEL